MKLTSAQVERTLTQFQGEAIPDNHPVIPQLNGLADSGHCSHPDAAPPLRPDMIFGKHTVAAAIRDISAALLIEEPEPGPIVRPTDLHAMRWPAAPAAWPRRVISDRSLPRCMTKLTK